MMVCIADVNRRGGKVQHTFLSGKGMGGEGRPEKVLSTFKTNITLHPSKGTRRFQNSVLTHWGNGMVLEENTLGKHDTFQTTNGSVHMCIFYTWVHRTHRETKRGSWGRRAGHNFWIQLIQRFHRSELEQISLLWWNDRTLFFVVLTLVGKVAAELRRPSSASVSSLMFCTVWLVSELSPESRLGSFAKFCVFRHE